MQYVEAEHLEECAKAAMQVQQAAKEVLDLAQGEDEEMEEYLLAMAAVSIQEGLACLTSNLVVHKQVPLCLGAGQGQSGLEHLVRALLQKFAAETSSDLSEAKGFMSRVVGFCCDLGEISVPDACLQMDQDLQQAPWMPHSQLAPSVAEVRLQEEMDEWAEEPPGLPRLQLDVDDWSAERPEPPMAADEEAHRSVSLWSSLSMFCPQFLIVITDAVSQALSSSLP